MPDASDSNALAEFAAEKWGPTLSAAIFHFENEFPSLRYWDIQQERGGDFISTVDEMKPGGGVWIGQSSADPAWALCLALQHAADAGKWQACPPPPPPPPELVK